MKVEIPTASISVIDYCEGFSESSFAEGGCEAPVVQVVGLKPEL